MATPTSVKTTYAGSTAAFDVEIGPTKENDLILILLAWRVSGTLAVSGYTALGTKSTTDSFDSQWFAKVAGSGVEANPSASTTGSAAVGVAISHVFRGCDISGGAAAAISDISSTAAGGAGSSLTSHALVTTTADCTILHGAVWDTTNIVPTNIADVNLLGTVQNVATGITYQATATTPGAISTFTWTGSNNTNTGRAWALAIKNDANAEPPVRIVDGRSWLQLLGGFSAPTTGIPDSVTGLTAIDGVNMNTVANTTAGTLTIGLGQPVSNPWPIAGTTFTCTQNLTATAWVGAFQSISETNIDGKIAIFPYGFQTTITTANVGTKGFIIVFVDNVDAWAAFTVIPRYKMAPGGFGDLILKFGTTTPLDSGGTIDWTKIVNIGYFFHRPAGTALSAGMIFFPSNYETTPSKIVGGGSIVPVTTAFESQYLLGGNLYFGATKFQGSGQLVNRLGLQLGDGSLATYVNHTAQAYDIPATDESLWRVGASGVPFTLKASAGDTIDLRAAIITSSILQPFTVDAASSLSAPLMTTGLSIIGRTFSDLAGYDWTSVSWAECDTVTIAGGGALTNCTIASTASANAALSITANGSTLDGCTIDGTGAAYALELGASVTAITLADCTLTAGSLTPFDKIHVLKTTGTVTITISGTTSLAAGDVTSAGATVVISAPLLYQTVMVSGATAGSRIQIYDTTSSTELYNGTPAFPYTWTDSAAAAADRAIRLRVSYVSGVTAKDFIEANIGTCGQTSGTAAVSYLVNQVADATYNSNAIDGPAIYATSGITFTDAATDRVNCNIGGGSVTYKTIYACFVYWNFTATGIANDFTYISAPDTANYLLSGMKIRNTSATDLSVTGGYGRDATSGASVDIIDTAGSTGNIFLAPDHVVAYATGSGVTAQDITDIAAATAAAVPSASTIATTTVGTAIDGTTTLAESIRLHNSVLAGKVSGAGTGTETFRDLADTKDRVVATVDTDGNRTAITRDAT